MPNKKMTDNEIVKGLEIHCNGEIGCQGCPLEKESDGLCVDCLARASLDLINRQKAEIERLNKALQVIEVMEEQHKWGLNKAKAEAYKEFADRLKQQKYQSSDWSHGEHPYVVEESDIDNTLIELVGDNDESTN